MHLAAQYLRCSIFDLLSPDQADRLRKWPDVIREMAWMAAVAEIEAKNGLERQREEAARRRR